MKIILKNMKNEYIKTLSLEGLDSLADICAKISSLKENLEVNIFAINEVMIGPLAPAYKPKVTIKINKT